MNSKGKGGSSSSSSSQACAACRHQRRKCQNCPLAPYFPPDQTQKFLNVHRLFGVSNVMKILNSTDARYWPNVMETIQFQADARKNDPVHGCLGIINHLRAQIDLHKKELETLNQQLYYYRNSGQPFHQQQQPQQQQQQQQFQPTMVVPPATMTMPPPMGVYQNQLPMGFVETGEASSTGQMMRNLSLENVYPLPVEEYEALRSADQLSEIYNNYKPVIIDHNEIEQSGAESIAQELDSLTHASNNKLKNVIDEFVPNIAAHNKGKKRMEK